MFEWTGVLVNGRVDGWAGRVVDHKVRTFSVSQVLLKKPKYLIFLVSVSYFLSVPVPIVTVLCVEAYLKHFSSKTVGVSPFSDDRESWWVRHHNCHFLLTRMS